MITGSGALARSTIYLNPVELQALLDASFDIRLLPCANHWATSPTISLLWCRMTYFHSLLMRVGSAPILTRGAWTTLHAHLHVNKTNFHIKGFALVLALKQRRKTTRKSPIKRELYPKNELFLNKS